MILFGNFPNKIITHIDHFDACQTSTIKPQITVKTDSPEENTNNIALAKLINLKKKMKSKLKMKERSGSIPSCFKISVKVACKIEKEKSTYSWR